MALSPCQVQVNEKGLELTRHGTSDFPIACYHDDLSVNTVPWHWHDELEAVVITEGTARFIAGTEEHTIGPGEGLFVNAGVFHAVFQAGSIPCRFHSLVFHPSLVGGEYNSIFYQQYVLPLTSQKSLQCICLSPDVPWQKQILTNIENTWQCCTQKTEGYPFQARNHLSDLVLQISRHFGSCGTKPDGKWLRDSQRMKTMLRYIAEHYGEPLSLQEIAASASVSESEALRCFRRIVRTTPVRYCRDYRLQQAASQLAATLDPVSEIAQRCGFQEMSYFSKMFREKYAMTPSEYRKKQGA